MQFFLRCFRDPIQVPRIDNRVPRIRENHHRVHRIKENRVPRIREIGSLQVHIGHLTFSLKKNLVLCNEQMLAFFTWISFKASIKYLNQYLREMNAWVVFKTSIFSRSTGYKVL